jgi:hypothetical protein
MLVRERGPLTLLKKCKIRVSTDMVEEYIESSLRLLLEEFTAKASALFYYSFTKNIRGGRENSR